MSSLLVLALALAPVEWPLPPSHTGLLYLSGYQSNNVGEYLPDGTLLRTFSVPNMIQPRGIAVDQQGDLVVVCQGSQRILRLDLLGNVIQTITHPDLTSGTGISQAPNGDWYIGNFTPGRVLVFDSTWNHVTTLTDPSLSGVNCVAFEASGDFAVTSAITGTVVRFDSAHNAIGTVTHPNFSSPMSIALDSSGAHYVSNGSSGRVVKFDATWAPLNVFGFGVLSAPQGIAVDENDVLTISNFSASTVHRYDTQGTLLGSWPLTGVTTARNLTWQTSRRIVARHGSVDAANGFPSAVLAITGQTPDAYGRISLALNQGFDLTLAAPPTGPASAPFVLWMVPGEPGLSDVEVLPSAIGLFAFATPLTGATPGTLMNAFGAEAILGFGALPPLPAPTTIATLPQGVGTPGTFTVQGLIIDNGSAAGPSLPVSATNALIVTFS